MERFRYKKSKAKQAQAKITQIARLEQERRKAAGELENLTRRRRTLGFEFLKPARTGGTVVDVDGLRLTAGGKQLIEGGSLVIERGEHIALVGPNGSGKTTLLETLVGHRPPDAGAIRFGHGVEPAYFSQHDVELDERGTVLDCAVAMTGLARPQAQQLLGRFLFSGYAEHEKQVSVLSGGERRRLSLAVVVASGANLLVLDEPTNHLDLESREALEAALEAFPGRSCSSPTTVRSSTQSPSAPWRSRSGHYGPTTAAGPTSCGRGRRRVAPDRARCEPEGRRSQARPSPRRGRKGRASSSRSSAASRRSSNSSGSSSRQLAEDWTNMETLTEYRTARDELQELLARWEALFESA